MIKKSLYLIKIKISDSDLVLKLSNEKKVRKWSLNHKKIKHSDHLRWLKSKLRNKNFYFWKFVNTSKCLGLVRIEKKNRKYFLSYLISKEYRGKGLGTIMIVKALNKINKKIIYAKSFSKNYSSNKTLINSGFKIFNKKQNINLYVYKK